MPRVWDWIIPAVPAGSYVYMYIGTRDAQQPGRAGKHVPKGLAGGGGSRALAWRIAEGRCDYKKLYGLGNCYVIPEITAKL